MDGASAAGDGSQVASTGRRERAEAPASLDVLRGARPEMLRDMYRGGHVASPVGVGVARGALLALEPLANVFALPGTLAAALSRHLPWQGKAFESGGTGGANMVLGRRVLRFGCAAGPSDLDGRPTLLLRYDGLGNPWPVSALVDELRQVSERVCLGPCSLRHGRGSSVLFWWGIELPGQGATLAGPRSPCRV